MFFQGAPRAPTGAKLIVFVIGGATYSEIRSVYEIAEAYNRDVFIGTTELLRPGNFIEHLGHLKQPVPTPRSLITPYTPPAPQQKSSDVGRAASLMSHMHIHSSSSQLSHKSSNVSLSTTDKMSVSSNGDDKEKKKKKGLKRFF